MTVEPDTRRTRRGSLLEYVLVAVGVAGVLAAVAFALFNGIGV